MPTKNLRKRISILLLLLFCRPIAAHAQNSEVDGTVLGPSGAVLAKASVEFRNRDTGIRRQTITSNDGIYHIREIDPGKYDATVEAGGFKTLTRENIRIHAGDKSQINFKMEIRLASHGFSEDRSGVNLAEASIGIDSPSDIQLISDVALEHFPIGVDRREDVNLSFYQEKLHITSLRKDTAIGKML